MKETRADIEAELVKRRERLAEVESHGAASLSRYDIEIAASGDADNAVATALYLLRNQIRYLESKLTEMPPSQVKLF